MSILCEDAPNRIVVRGSGDLMHWCLIRDRSRFRPATVVGGWGDDMSRFARGSFSLVRGRVCQSDSRTGNGEGRDVMV